ncbi:hypothetical protein [Pseudomonas phage PS-1]|uniref:hypothetical protein n=1 Tax=Pseudomonas phage PS-1 TaxID=1573458 RepID=UPI00065C1D52|nr:hypothetical protein AXI79_gp70 [Pseudomonas phage PS-1]BAR92408.1 hypothetical protein [Pseudomonas phage PS-1]
MNNSAINFWSGFAWIAAIINIVASLIVMVAFGTTEVPAGRHSSITESVVLWPVILGCIASAVYGIFFAVLMSIARIAALNSRTALGLMLKPEAGS